MNTHQQNGAAPQPEKPTPTNPTSTNAGAQDKSPIDRASGLIAQASDILARQQEAVVAEAVAKERARILGAAKDLSRFFRNCASNAEAHGIVATNCIDKHASSGALTAYTRAANHLDSLIKQAVAQS